MVQRISHALPSNSYNVITGGCFYPGMIFFMGVLTMEGGRVGKL